MDILTTFYPYEIAENIEGDEEAMDMCCAVLKRWTLSQESYEEILGKIPDSAIKQYLRKKIGAQIPSYIMQENERCCLMCKKVFDESELEQHLEMHRERNETCAISDSHEKTIIYYKRGYLQDINSDEDAPKHIDTTTLREKILEEIRKIEEDDIMQQPTAPIDVNAPLALMQCTLDGQIQALKLVLKLIDKEENNNTK